MVQTIFYWTLLAREICHFLDDHPGAIPPWRRHVSHPDPQALIQRDSNAKTSYGCDGGAADLVTLVGDSGVSLEVRGIQGLSSGGNDGGGGNGISVGSGRGEGVLKRSRSFVELSEADERLIVELFELFDTNGDNSISQRELAGVLRAMGVQVGERI